MELKVKKLRPSAQMPSFAHEGDACFDISAAMFEEFDMALYIIPPGESRIVPTGLAFEVPFGWMMAVHSRSGHGFKNGIRLANSEGIIDAGFRGELMLKLHNDGHNEFRLTCGERIAQARLERIEPVTFVEVDELSDTARGTGGFGSTGK